MKLRTKSHRVSNSFESFESLESRQLLSATLTVDDTPGTGAQFSTIQAAVNAASPGDTVKVAAGVYNETVTVDKSLNIVGAQANHNGATRSVPATQESVVTGAGGSFVLNTDNVVVNGFTVQGATGAPGITTSASHGGYVIVNDIIQNNTFGLYLNSSASANPSVVAFNAFKTNNVPGSASGNGIYSDQGLHNAFITRNSFTGNVNSAITLAGNPGTQDNIEISRNTSSNDANFANIYNTSDIEITRNTITESAKDPATQGSAIFLAGGNSDVDITRNQITGGSFSGVAVRNIIGDSNEDVFVSRNTVIGRDFGINVTDEGAGVVKVTRNTVSQNGVGIFFGALTNGNLIERNLAKGNTLDGEDDSGATAATVKNKWVRNVGDTSVPPGLFSSSKVKGHDVGADSDDDQGDNNDQGGHGHGHGQDD